MQYRELWKLLRASREDLQRAADFYAQSPTGQYDNLAEAAIRAVLEQMRRDDSASKI